MNLKYHATMKCKAATLNLRRIQSIRQFLDQSTCEILVCSLVLTQLDYSNGILHGTSECVICKFQKVENFVAKVVLTGKFLRVPCKHCMTYIGSPYMQELILRFL